MGFKADQTALDFFFKVVSPQSLKMLFNPNHFCYADIIYVELNTLEDNDIVYLKNGKQIKGRIVKRSPQQVKIEVNNNLQKNIPNDQIIYQANEVEKVGVHFSRKKVSIFWKIFRLVFLGPVFLILFVRELWYSL